MTFEPRDWLTIIGFVFAIFFQSFVFWRWLSTQFSTRDREVQDAVRERNALISTLRNENTTFRTMAREDIARVDKDVAALRNEFSIKLAMIPTRDAMESMLRDRVSPLESDLRSLVIELARLGFHSPTQSAKPQLFEHR